MVLTRGLCVGVLGGLVISYNGDGNDDRKDKEMVQKWW